jgi:hypothetical protein
MKSLIHKGGKFMKRKVFLTLFIVFLAYFFLSNEALAAWTQAKGHAYNQLTFSYYKSKAKYDTVQSPSNVPKKIKQPEFDDYKLTYYGEYGITDNFTVFTSIPYVWIVSDEALEFDGNDGPDGVGDINVGVRQKISNNLFGTGVLMSFQPTLKIPEAYQLNWNLKQPIYTQNVGDGQYDLTLALLFGKGFSKGYAVVNAGYKFRFEETKFDFKPSDQIVVRIDAGYSILPKLSLRGNFEWIKSIGNATVSYDSVVSNIQTFGAEALTKEQIIKDALGLEPHGKGRNSPGIQHNIENPGHPFIRCGLKRLGY